MAPSQPQNDPQSLLTPQEKLMPDKSPHASDSPPNSPRTLSPPAIARGSVAIEKLPSPHSPPGHPLKSPG